MADNKREVLQDAQVSVLGSMLIDERCVGIVMQLVKADYFTASQYRRVFDAIRDLAARSKPVDPVTVLDAVGNEYRGLLAQIMDLTPTAKNVREYCKILRREARMQMLRDAANDMLTAETEDDIRATLDRVNAVMVDRPGVRMVNMSEALADFYKRHDPNIKPDYLPLVFPKLDDLRIARGDLVYIGGYPSDGKTTLALTLAREQAKTKRVGFFSLETSCEKLTDAMVCAAAQIGLPAVQLNAMGQRDWDKLAAVSADFCSRNLEIIDAAGMSVTDMRLYTMAHHYDVIYIDYIQLLPATGKGSWVQREFDRVSANSLALKQLGRQTGVTVIALSQMTRPERNKDGKIPPPTMSNLRSSGQLEQDADAVLLMFREDPTRSNSDRIITVGKIKTGPAGGSFYLEFDGPRQTFKHSARNLPSDHGQKKERYPEQVEFEELPRDTPVPWPEGG